MGLLRRSVPRNDNSSKIIYNIVFRRSIKGVLSLRSATWRRSNLLQVNEDDIISHPPPIPPSCSEYYAFYYLCAIFYNNSDNNNQLIQWGKGFLNIKVLICRR